MKPKLVIWGAAGHATTVADIVRLRDEYELAGFIDDRRPERRGEVFCHSPVLGGLDEVRRLRAQGVTHVLPGFGNPAGRDRVMSLAREEGLDAATALHPHAVVAVGVAVGSGTVIKAGAIVDPGVVIEQNVIVGHGATIGHGSTVRDNVTLSGGVNLAGLVTVGRLTWVATGTNVRDRLRIGERCLIGLGSVVVWDIPDGVVAYGVPARVRRQAMPEDFL